MEVLINPIIIAVILLCALCMCKINVLMALIMSALVAGVVANIPVTEVMQTFISGMGENSEIALSYILLGAFAAAMTHTGLADILAKKITIFIRKNKYLLFLLITAIAICSQNLIPIHIAFIPILIPPLLNLMNELKIDRRAIACALAYGLKMPYIVVPAGFGLIFQGLIADNMTQNGMVVDTGLICHYTIILGIAMTIGLLTALIFSYRKPREYQITTAVMNEQENISAEETSLNKNHYITIFAAIVTLLVQLWTKSLPLGALLGLSIIFCTRTIKHSKTDNIINEGIGIMGYVAFVMLTATGFAAVLKSTGGIDTLVNFAVPYLNNNFTAVLFMLIIGLFITIGIGTSFGTIPILAVLFVPICVKMGFSVPLTIIVLAAAAALGDAGSPASDTTIGPTSGLNADGQHKHIDDTCIPTFLHYNIPLIIFALLAVFLF